MQLLLIFSQKNVAALVELGQVKWTSQKQLLMAILNDFVPAKRISSILFKMTKNQNAHVGPTCIFRYEKKEKKNGLVDFNLFIKTSIIQSAIYGRQH